MSESVRDRPSSGEGVDVALVEHVPDQAPHPFEGLGRRVCPHAAEQVGTVVDVYGGCSVLGGDV